MNLPHQNLLDKKKAIEHVIEGVKSGRLNVTPQGDDTENAKEALLARQEAFLREINTEIAKATEKPAHETKAKK